LKRYLFISVKWHRTVSILLSRHKNMCISLWADLHLINLKPTLYASVIMVLKTVYTFSLNVHFVMKIKQYSWWWKSDSWLKHRNSSCSALFIHLLEAPIALTNVTSIPIPVHVVFSSSSYLFLLFWIFRHFLSSYFSFYFLYYYRLIISYCKFICVIIAIMCNNFCLYFCKREMTSLMM
jgi:hypothetical protein